MSVDNPIEILYDISGNPIGVSYENNVYRIQTQTTLSDGYDQLGTRTNPLCIDPVGQTVQPIFGGVVCMGNAPVDYAFKSQPVVVGGTTSSNIIQTLNIDGYSLATLEVPTVKKTVKFDLMNGDGYGTNLAVDGYVVNRVYSSLLLYDFYMYKMEIKIHGAGNSPSGFGAAPQLLHGLQIQFHQTGSIGNYQYNWINLAEIFSDADKSSSITSAYSDTTDLSSAIITFKPPIVFLASNGDNITATVRDDLSSNIRVSISATGLIG